MSPSAHRWRPGARARQHGCPQEASSMRSRIRWRSWRLTRLRSTAEPTALLTTKPTDVGPPVPGTLGFNQHVGDEGGLYGFGSTTDRVPEVIPAAHALDAREQRLRQTAWRGPCGDGPRGSRGRRGCACGGGSRASWHDDGCSAGKYACSRCVPHGSQSGPVDGHRSPTTEKVRLSWACGGSRSRTTRQRYGRPGPRSN